MDYQWEIETLADCGDGLDTYNLRELRNTVKHDALHVMEEVVKRWDKRIEDDIAEKHLCPNCLSELQARYKICYSNGWYEPPGIWEEWDGNYCDCGWEE